MGSTFNSELDKSLQLLYAYSSNFQISVELIQRLAQQLKLETFIDNLGFQLQNSTNNTNVQKLTIAASSILLDLDFESDTKIVNLSLSINGSENLQTGEPYTIHKDELGLTHVKLNCNNNRVTFLNKSSNSNKTQVEEILLSNLQGPKLGNFPANLQYLAIIDKFANHNPELFIYIETISFLLNTINQIDKELEDWQPEFGILGNVKLNQDKKLGVVLDFWKDYRFINREYRSIKGTDELLVGQNYELKLNVVDSTNQVDYLIDNQIQEWEIAHGKYKFEFENTLKPLVVDGDNFSAWALQLELNHSVYLPVFVLEYLGFLDYTTSEAEQSLKDVFEKVNNGEEFEQVLNIDSNNVSFQFSNNIPSKFVNLKSVNINQLLDIPKIIPVLRNFIVLSNLIRTVINNKSTQVPIFNNKRRRSSRLLGIATSEKELTEEAKQKLKESLKLPDDVTDEEILGLSAISETANYSTIQPVNNKDEIDLDNFLQNEPNGNGSTSSNNNEMEGIKFSDSQSYFLMRIEDIEFSNKGEVQLIFEGNVDAEEILIHFKISNGEIQIVPNGTSTTNTTTTITSDDMETDDTPSSKFIKGLNLTEDIISSYKSAY
ncbi:conserved hypothetical protein [Candida tropicalis MYA-3404]|uniref:Mediator of RNA polymerase II transcription subunit 1 n=1 Tax=Candida tropicalis (strain ATCC MYA-3404 / T1) TaxID=294747 RepID=C5M6G5_CANTT|nr:conserved hypothetical protein [Candida tropicalis MYA-3404]EER34585.1 conserved hypothetical protein [Candida tropicalis MYA-3404]KAG4408458.1 hypothetical protein JTP64_001764 [Candida tropicalis]